MLEIAGKLAKCQLIFTLSWNELTLVLFQLETAVFVYCFLLLVSFVYGTVLIAKITFGNRVNKILVNPGSNLNLISNGSQGRLIRSRFLCRFRISTYLNMAKMTLVSFRLKTRDSGRSFRKLTWKLPSLQPFKLGQFERTLLPNNFTT